MEEDSGVKAPVTRLRRRLSVEQTEETNSPASNTPTKRRPGRRPAKPELELIDENGTPQDIKKSAAKELIEYTEEKPITPSRRSARIRSNTSIVSETATVDSPRAKRATRRLSQVGSDTEGSVTPVRQTRRTRKDSTSSIDKADNQAPIKQSNIIPEVITEETETNKQLVTSLTNHEKDEVKPVRKSPRLQEKKGRRSRSSQNESDQSTHEENLNKSRTKLEPIEKEKENDTAPAEVHVVVTSDKNENAELLQNISSNPKKDKSVLNKSTSALESFTSKTNRLRTQSCTIAMEQKAHDNISHSDNESSKKSFRGFSPLINKSGMEKSVLNKSKNKDKSITKDEPDITDHEISNKYKQNVYDDEKDNAESNTNDTIKNKSIDVQNIFESNPTSNMQVTISMEDTDSNSANINRDDDDQRVPELGGIILTSYRSETFNTTKEKKNIDDTCEPMDVDETIPDSLLIEDKGDASETEHSLHKSKRKSSILLNLDDSGNQNKSTLVLSHLKDISSTSETNKSSKSPLKTSSNRLSNSSAVLNITQENIPHNKNLSLCYSTSTPLQHKTKEKENVNTSATNNDSTLSKSKGNKSRSESESSKLDTSEKKNHKLKKKQLSTTNPDDSDNESSQENNDFMDDEAEDAGDDYESGDSQDEEERKEALENEIRDKGETLSSEEDISDDSDYEKDSFIVSSAEEDNELLEGTDDDLSMSDNELNMSRKSKEKYNKRKLKEQKNASREMYGSRHQINNSNNSLVSDKRKEKKRTRQRLSSSESDHEIKKTFKSNKKRILDSSQDESMSNEINTKTSRRSKTPSQSISNEKEITLLNQTSNESDPLSVSIKTEPKTPQNGNLSLAFINEHNDSKATINEDEKCDPLATTIANDDDSSMSSDNERIVQDYDSVLQGLNKTKEKKIKTGDISLNIDSKKNNKEKNKIVDQLNLTQVKPKKDKKQIVAVKTNPVDDTDENSSDSALLHLLFSEDSSNCEDSSNKAKNLNDSDEYISLERADGKTEIQNKSVNEPLLDQTNPKTLGSTKKKRQQSDSSHAEEPGTNESLVDQSTKTPASGKKKQHQSEISVHEELGINNTVINQSTSKMPSSGKKKKQKNVSECEATAERDTNESQNNKTPASGKKKRHQSETSVHEELSANISAADQSVSKTPASGKKKKQKRKSESEATGERSLAEGDLQFFIDTEGSKEQNISMTNKSLNRSKVSFSEDTNVSLVDQGNKTPASGKKKRHQSESTVHEELGISNSAVDQSILKTPGSGKKKKQKRKSESEASGTETAGVQFDDAEGNKEQNVSISNKSLNRSKISLPNKAHDSDSDAPVEVSFKKETVQDINDTELSHENSINQSMKSKKKKKKKGQQPQTVETKDAPQDSNKSVTNTSSDKKQKHSNISISEVEPKEKTPHSGKKNKDKSLLDVEHVEANKSADTTERKNKKRKRNTSSLASEEDKNINEPETSVVSKTKKVKLTQQEGHTTEISKQNRSKKRKQREDDNFETATKTSAENSSKKIQISRLPTALLEQLDEKPKKLSEAERKPKKPKVIATTNFVVEGKVRRNKPSMYLEESIYLNEDETEYKKSKDKNLKPKVLPFVPTALTSIQGYTSNFKVNVLSKDTKFVAQSNNINNFKTDYLYNKKIKRNGTYEMYKMSRNIKLSKF